jgi:vanillate O-demethylase ferredoxin subunit
VSDTIDAIVSRRWRAAEGIAAFELRREDGAELPAFTAGAHIDVHVPGGYLRQYSLVNAPHERDRYIIAVKRLEDGRGGSRAMHEDVHAGSRVTIGPPRNHFELADDERPVLLVSGGIGITPLLAMAQTLKRRNAAFSLHCVSSGRGQLAFAAEIEAGVYGDCVHLYDRAVRLNPAELAAAAPPDVRVYLCGPAKFMAAIRDAFSARDDAEIHCEYFTPGDAPASPPAHDCFELRLARQGHSLTVPSSGCILEELRKLGMDPEVSCEQGVCGTCITRVLSGEIDHRDYVLTDSQRSAGDTMAICVSRGRPGTTLVIDV